MQAIEDLFDDDQREDCIAFFQNKDFTFFAEMAEMDLTSQVGILDLVKLMIEASAPHHDPYKLKDAIASC